MLVLQQPTELQAVSIYDEFETTAEKVRRDARELVKWLAKQRHLPNVTDEQFLVNCLIRCKNSLEKTKTVLERYYTIRALMPEIYDNRNPNLPEIQLAIKGLCFLPLPLLGPDYCRVSIFRVFDPSLADSVNPDDVIKAMFMGADLRLKIDLYRSDILIFDLRDITVTIITLMMANLRKFLTPGTKGLPLRLRTAYVINAPPTAESLIMLAKSFIRKNLVKKIIVLKKQEELLKVLPTKILPKDYGGEEPTLVDLKDEWIELLKEHRDWFLAENDVKADTSKKLVHENSGYFDLSLDGSFRKISLD